MYVVLSIKGGSKKISLKFLLLPSPPLWEAAYTM